jgi:riboflavin transporter FmnP
MKIGSREIAVASILGALAAMSEMIVGPPFDVPFPLLPRISWDFTGIPIMVSVFLYGPVTGVYTCLIGCSVIFLRGNVYGGVLKVIAELATILAFIILRRGIVSNAVGAITSRVLVMTVANFFLLQLFYGMPELVVMGLLIPIGFFNVTQALINIIPAYQISWSVRIFKV